MFNNIINIHDFIELFRRIRHEQALLRKVRNALSRSSQKRVENAWAETESPPIHWWDIPAVKNRWNEMITGDSQTDYYQYIAQKYLAGRSALKALSLGCGAGHRELRWLELTDFRRIDGYDLSAPRIEAAQKTAREKQLDHILNYNVGDVLNLKLPPNEYDVIMIEQSLHHFSPLREILTTIEMTLKPRGCFIVNEFVGPTRFQWTDEQLRAVNALLTLFPVQYKTLVNTNIPKQAVHRPGRLRMLISDPSEAVQSADILPLLHEIFLCQELKGYGGAVLHLLYNGIGHHFVEPDTVGMRLLKLSFEVEDLLLATNILPHDFIIAVFQKKTS